MIVPKTVTSIESLISAVKEDYESWNTTISLGLEVNWQILRPHCCQNCFDQKKMGSFTKKIDYFNGFE